MAGRGAAESPPQLHSGLFLLQRGRGRRAQRGHSRDRGSLGQGPRQALPSLCPDWRGGHLRAPAGTQACTLQPAVWAEADKGEPPGQWT